MDAYDELYADTMGRPGFILQHVVDAHMAQELTADSKRIGAVFALVGLYLYLERGFSGTQVQQVHRRLGARKRQITRSPDQQITRSANPQIGASVPSPHTALRRASGPCTA